MASLRGRPNHRSASLLVGSRGAIGTPSPRSRLKPSNMRALGVAYTRLEPTSSVPCAAIEPTVNDRMRPPRTVSTTPVILSERAAAMLTRDNSTPFTRTRMLGS
jgi:hypothetical protein